MMIGFFQLFHNKLNFHDVVYMLVLIGYLLNYRPLMS